MPLVAACRPRVGVGVLAVLRRLLTGISSGQRMGASAVAAAGALPEQNRSSQARDGAPAYVPMVVCDHVAGEIAAGAIPAAVVKRNAAGGGSSLEVPTFETMAVFVLQEHLAQ